MGEERGNREERLGRRLKCANYKNENLIDVITLLIKSGFKVTEETRDYFQKNYKETNRTEVLQLLHV
jgi:hypothetical protein